MKFYASLIVFLVALCAFSSRAEEASHLEPVEGYFSSFAHSHVHLSAVRDILVRDAVDSPAAMVTVPSFEPESIVFLLSRKGTMFVVSTTASAQIYSNKKKGDIKSIRKEKAINAELAEQISAVFALITAQTRYPKDKIIGFDGVTYYFSAFTVGIGIRAGQIWSPESKTIPGKLVTLGEHLHSYVKGDLSEETLRLEVQALLVILDRADRSPEIQTDTLDETITRTHSEKNVTMSLTMSKTSRADSEVLLTLHIENHKKSLIGATLWNIEIRNSSGQRVAETESGSDRFFKLRPLPEGSSVAKMAVWERGPKMKVRLLPGQKSTEKMDLAHLFKLQPGKYHLKASTTIQMQVDEEAGMRLENVPFEIMK